MSEDFVHQLDEELGLIREMLIAKNANYGDSALTPLRVFSQADTLEQIKVRIDDKLSRVKAGKVFGDEDAVADLIGYLFLLRIKLRGGS